MPELRPWLTVALLAALYAVSMIDRLILALLVTPLSRDLGITDAQFGLLFGFGFVAVYLAGGFVAGHLADLGSRRALLAGGVFLWSAMTFCAGLADSFATLLACRLGVAAGEAVLTPVAVSVIGDLFPEDRRTMPTSVYVSSGAVMGSGAFIVGAGVIAMAQAVAPLASLPAWRLTLMIVAAPGFLGALLVLLMLPSRGRRPGAKLPSRRGEFAALLRQGRSFYGGTFLGVAAIAMVSVANVAWTPTRLVRDFGLEADRAGLLFGTAALCGGVFGSLVPPVFARRAPGSDRIRQLLRLGLLSAGACLPVAAAATLSQSLALVLVGVFMTTLAAALASVLALNLIQDAAPAEFRARVTAIYLSVFAVVAQGLGPVSVPMISGALPGAGSRLGEAIALLAAAATAFALLAFNRAAKGAPRPASAREA